MDYEAEETNVNRNNYVLASLGFLSGMVFLCPPASAFDIGIDIGMPRREVVVVQPPPAVVRHWVPAQVVTRQEQVLVEPARIEKRAERVLVEPGHVDRRREQVLVKEAFVEKRWVPVERVDEVRIGPVRIDSATPAGRWVVVTVPAQYQVVVKEYPVPDRYETVVREVQIPARYQTVTRNVVVPAHWEEVAVAPPPVPVVQPGVGVDLELDIHGHRR